jgi:hypothetical protein
MMIFIAGLISGVIGVSITKKGRAFFVDLWVKLRYLFSTKVDIESANYGCVDGDTEAFRVLGSIKPIEGYITWYLDTDHLSKRSISREDAIKGLKKGFGILAPHMSNVEFKEVLSKEGAQIVIGFYKNGEQGLPKAFSPNTLAYAYLANNTDALGIVSDMFFNERFLWALSHGAGRINFTKVFVHEVLHSLGMYHNTADKSSILYPSYSPNNTIKLATDDINGLKFLYEKYEGPTDTPDDDDDSDDGNGGGQDEDNCAKHLERITVLNKELAACRTKAATDIRKLEDTIKQKNKDIAVSSKIIQSIKSLLK